jgi:hypothetical protein
MKTINCALAVLLLAQSAHAQDTPRKAYELLVGCSVVYAKSHPSKRLTATELADAAVASCDSFANQVRDLAYRDGLAAAQKALTPRQQELLGGELQRTTRENAEAIRADAVKRARLEVLQALAEP